VRDFLLLSTPKRNANEESNPHNIMYFTPLPLSAEAKRGLI
jgi:hypothetical protein